MGGAVELESANDWRAARRANDRSPMAARIWCCGRGLGSKGRRRRGGSAYYCRAHRHCRHLFLDSFSRFFFFIHEGSEAWLKGMESFLPATGFLYWVGVGTVAYLALHISCFLFTAVRVWGLGNESGVGPRLGEWAGESNSAPPSPDSCCGSHGSGPGLARAD